MVTIQRLTGHAKMSETGTELDIWLYRIHVRSYNLAASAGIAVSFVSIVNLFLTFPWAKLRNRKKHQYVTAGTLTMLDTQRVSYCISTL